MLLIIVLEAQECRSRQRCSERCSGYLGAQYACALKPTGNSIITPLAADGLSVGVIDTDIQSPGIHILFGLEGHSIGHSLNDFLWGRCAIRQAAHDVTATPAEAAWFEPGVPTIALRSLRRRS